MERPFVSIIVPVRNAARTIDTTFGYLMNIDYPQGSLEIIFADGGSTDGTADKVRDYHKKHPFVRLVEISDCPSPGFARTEALKKAKGDFIFFTDGDCAPCSDWIDKMIKIFNRDGKIGAVGGEIFTLRVEESNLVEIYCEAFGFNRVSWRYGNLHKGLYPTQEYLPTQICGHRSYFFVTANVAYRKEALEDAERKFWDLPTGEDINFGIRVREKGWKFYFLPEASVEHMHRADLKALLRVWHTYGQAHPPLLAAHSKNYMEIVLQFLGQWPKLPIIKIPFFIKGFIYIGNFHLMHICGFIFLAAFMLQWLWPGSLMLRLASWIFFGFTAVLAFKFFRPAFNIEPYNSWPFFAKLKYLTNLYFFLGGLKGSVKYKTICIEPSF